MESKFHQLSKDITEKNLAYDFLWMQLHITTPTPNHQRALSSDIGPIHPEIED